MKTKPMWVYWRTLGKRDPVPVPCPSVHTAKRWQREDAEDGFESGPIVRVDVPLPEGKK